MPDDRRGAKHSLVEDLPEPEVHAALRFAEHRRHAAPDPVTRALDNAPFDNEPLTSEDIAEPEGAERNRNEGSVLSKDETRQELVPDS